MIQSPYLVWLGVGAVLALPFLFAWLWWLVFLGAVGLLYLVVASPTYKVVWWGAVLAGSLKAAAAIIWFWSVYPLTWAGLEPGLGQLSLIGVYWVSVAVSIGVGFAAVCFFLKYCLVTDQRFLYLFPFAVVASELIGSLTFSIYSLGPGSVPNINFSFGYLGHALISSSFFLGPAAYGGVYLLSLLVGLFGLLVYLAITATRTSHRVWIGGVLGVLVVGTVGFSYYIANRTLPSELPTVLAIDTLFDPDIFLDDTGFALKASAIESAVGAALAYSTDIVVLPEDSRFVQQYESSEEALAFIERTMLKDVIVIDSARTVDERGETVLRGYVFDTERDMVYELDKEYLVPQGEFIPYFHHVLFLLLGEQEFVSTLQRNQSYRPGLKTSYATIPESVPGLLFCMESVSPFGVKSIQQRHDVPLVVHPISHGWFNTPKVFWMNLERMLKGQAIWNETVIVEASNLAPSRAYLPNGKIQSGQVLEQTPLWRLVYYGW